MFNKPIVSPKLLTVYMLLFGTPGPAYISRSVVRVRLIWVRLNAFIRRCVKLWYRDKSAPCIEDIFGDCDDQLFAKINTNSLHILQQYLPERSSFTYSLRPRRHNKTLITKTSELDDRDFIIRNIYNNLYWSSCVFQFSIYLLSCLLLGLYIVRIVFDFYFL